MPAHISRRELLKWASAGAGAAAVGGATYAFGRQDAPSQTPSAFLPSESTNRVPATAAGPASTPATVGANPDLASRLLVVIEMDGGNDGMSMLVPYGSGRYYDLRPSTAVPENEVLALDDEVGLHGALTRIHARGAAVLQGVGTATPDGSHFEMLSRWWSGAPGGSGVYDAGFLGRLADAIGDPAAAAVALSVGSGNHPAILSRSVSTLSLPGADSIDYLIGANEDDTYRQLFQRSYERFGQGASRSDTESRLRAVKSQTLTFSRSLMALDTEEDGDDGVEYPGSRVGDGLQLAAQLFATDLGVRIVHVPMQLDFDTHDDHSGRYPGLMQELDAAVGAFFDDIDRRGLTDRVLLMTTSEFGRTAHDNDSGGLDHGTASNVLLMGPVNAGRHGDHPSLDSLDDNGDLIATVSLDQYYATVAEGWFGVPSGDVLDGSPAPVPGIVG